MKTLAALLFCLVLGSAGVRGADAPPGSPNRFKEAISAFEAEDAKTPPAPGGVLFTGSSSIRRWTTLAEDFPGVRTINRGFGGSYLSDCVHYFDRIVPAHRPRLVVLFAGTNDLNGGRTPEEVAGSFRAFCNKLHTALPEAKILYISIGLAPSRWKIADKMALTNALIAAHCAADPRRKFVDLNPHTLSGDGEPRPELYVADRLHLNAAGYAIWRKHLAPHLAE
ncbi:MAG: hypothetical protein JNK23_20615 [Opitutaceae bacterium]|nr:hypothetical protein [Opitutaceae bacterium]